MDRIKKKRKIGIYILCILLCESIGITSGLLSNAGSNEWFDLLIKPDWNPPSWLFAPVWTILYLLMGMSLAMVRTNEEFEKNKRAAYILFGTQLFLNFWWSLIFFRFHSPFFALIDILLMLAAIAATIIAFSRISKRAALLLLPYLAWVAFAAVLNYAIWNLNS